MKELLLAYIKNYTEVSDDKLQEVIEELEIKAFTKGTVLIRQGDIPLKCYFVLKGLIRQYSIDMGGNENTSNFYSENQTAAVFNKESVNVVSKYFLSCLEDCILLVGDLSGENKMYEKYPFLESMVKKCWRKIWLYSMMVSIH